MPSPKRSSCSFWVQHSEKFRVTVHSLICKFTQNIFGNWQFISNRAIFTVYPVLLKLRRIDRRTGVSSASFGAVILAQILLFHVKQIFIFQQLFRMKLRFRWKQLGVLCINKWLPMLGLRVSYRKPLTEQYSWSVCTLRPLVTHGSNLKMMRYARFIRATIRNQLQLDLSHSFYTIVRKTFNFI